MEEALVIRKIHCCETIHSAAMPTPGGVPVSSSVLGTAKKLHIPSGSFQVPKALATSPCFYLTNQKENTMTYSIVDIIQSGLKLHRPQKPYMHTQLKLASRGTSKKKIQREV